MKTLKFKKRNLLYILLAAVITSCSVVVFDDVNDYRGSTILKIERDSVGTIDAYNIYIKDTLGNYDVIMIRPAFAELFSVGDTL